MWFSVNVEPLDLIYVNLESALEQRVLHSCRNMPTKTAHNHVSLHITKLYTCPNTSTCHIKHMKYNPQHNTTLFVRSLSTHLACSYLHTSVAWCIILHFPSLPTPTALLGSTKSTSFIEKSPLCCFDQIIAAFPAFGRQKRREERVNRSAFSFIITR